MSREPLQMQFSTDCIFKLSSLLVPKLVPLLTDQRLSCSSTYNPQSAPDLKKGMLSTTRGNEGFSLTALPGLDVNKSTLEAEPCFAKLQIGNGSEEYGKSSASTAV